MATSHNIYTVGSSTAVQVSPNNTHSGVDITIQNINASGYIYVGNENVTTSSYGFRILPNHSISFELASPDALYAIGSTGGLSVAVITIGLES